MKTIGIFPAAGGLGGSTYNHLLQHPEVQPNKVTLISRNPDKIPASYSARGVRLLQASYESTPAELKAAFAGIQVLFLISYPSHVRDYRVKVQLPAIDAAHKAGVKHIFYSSLGFALPEETESLAEVMQAHLVSEEHLQKLANKDPTFSWTSIREGLYHESFPIYTSFWTLQNPVDKILIPHDGTGPGVSWVKRDELGEASASLIAQYATSSDPSSYPWNKRRVVLTGPKEWTLADTVKVLGNAVGREVRIKQISIDEWVKLPQITGYFGEEAKARTWATAWDAIRAGETKFVSPTLGEILGREPEAFEVTIGQLAKDARGA
ncbi:unnamed protein product [Clonostachys rhizophaga]|uniref:NmrA-like domain-containing protein n=1 Tax=Clonostachys rhizophaga TaxID=160324 RepID=A0A9N9V9Q1_9HYPO|nr:unnamed protein product [Clonostachys rhizophaga]